MNKSIQNELMSVKKKSSMQCIFLFTEESSKGESDN